MGLMIYVPQMLIAAMAMNLGTQRASAAAVGLTGIFAYSSTVLSGWGIGKIVDTAGWNGAFQMLIGCAVVTAALMALTWNVGAHAETTHPLSPEYRGEGRAPQPPRRRHPGNYFSIRPRLATLCVPAWTAAPRSITSLAAPTPGTSPSLAAGRPASASPSTPPPAATPPASSSRATSARGLPAGPPSWFTAACATCSRATFRW